MTIAQVSRFVTAALVIVLSAPLVAMSQRPPSRVNDEQRELLEKRFKDRIDSIVTQRLRLTEEQQHKLREIASRTEESRRVVRREEFVLRTSLRDAMKAGERANEAKVGELLEQIPRLERRKLELMESEQRDLAKFLSPTQRARYFGIQEELRRGMQDLQRRRMDMGDSSVSPTDGRGTRRRGPPPAV